MAALDQEETAAGAYAESISEHPGRHAVQFARHGRSVPFGQLRDCRPHTLDILVGGGLFNRRGNVVKGEREERTTGKREEEQ